MQSMVLLTTTVALPQLANLDTNISKNKVKQLAQTELTTAVDISVSNYEDYFELKTTLAPPLDRIYLRKHGSKSSTLKNKPCIDLAKKIDLSEITEKTKFKWISHPKHSAMPPDKIIESWHSSFSFVESDDQKNIKGLRTPQLGALHSILAYYSQKNNFDPATVVLPTGTGKTETMLATLVAKGIQKLIVIVPSSALRTQIANKFLSLGKLYDLDLIPFSAHSPAVAIISSRIQSITEAKELLDKANVIVAIPQALAQSSHDVISYICNECSDLFVDEAHHIAAKKWELIRNHFKSKKVIQFTATPYRNDGKPVGGKIIYNYTMGEAQEDGYFRHINMIAINEYNQRAKDIKIAQKAVSILENDIANGYDHILMARVNTTNRADELLPLYQRIAEKFKPIVIHNKIPSQTRVENIARLCTGKSKIVICVDMLGEGFDLPTLKIAALHEIHKSLPITLQFIGRFTRTSNELNISDASVVVNVADQEVEKGLQSLYSQDSDWDSVLKKISENRIDKEIKLQTVIDNLRSKGNLHDQISLWNLRPGFSTVLYRTKCRVWSPEKFIHAMPANSNYWYAISTEDNILVVLAQQDSKVKFGKFNELHNSVYNLLIAHWNKKINGLFIFATDYKWFKTDSFSKSITNDDTIPLSGPRIFNVFNNIRFPLVRNLGGMPQGSMGSISFTQYLGANVTEGLAQIERSAMTLSNLAVMGYDNGDRVIWGASQKKGKIWSVAGGSIYDWKNWATTAWTKVNQGSVDTDNITKEFLRPHALKKKYPKYACAISWGEGVQFEAEDRVHIYFDEHKTPFYLVDITIENNGTGPYQIYISDDNVCSTYSFEINAKHATGYSCTHIDGPEVLIGKGSRAPLNVIEHIESDPWAIHYVDGAYSFNKYLIKPSIKSETFNAEDIIKKKWTSNIRKESMGKTRNKNSIQWEMFKEIENDYPIIINDDGKNEAADLVCLKESENKIILTLIHCKYSSTETPASRITDFYEVCGQAQKSIRWKHIGMHKLFSHLKRREETWHRDGYSRFLKGNIAQLSTLKQKSRVLPIELHVILVQPGLDTPNKNILRLLGTTELYLKHTAKASLEIISS